MSSKQAYTSEEGLEGDDDLPPFPDGKSDSVPYNPAQIDIVTQNRTIETLLKRLKYDELDLSPDFQRNANLWDDVRKTSLIESLLLRIPIPSLYISEDKDGNYSVVDGLQRLSAIAHFVDVDALNDALGSGEKINSLVLKEKGLKAFGDLKGKTFNELERPLQRRITETELVLHVIRSGTPASVKFNIFSRINQGGLPLKAQEIRNAIFPSIWRKKIRELVESKEFLEATEHKIKVKRMEDIELMLRAVALYHQKELRPNDQNLEDYLNNFVEKECQHWDEAKWQAVQSAIKEALRVAPSLFDNYVFRKFYTSKRKPINVGLFEAQVGLLARLTKEDHDILLKNKEYIIKLFMKISDENEYRKRYDPISPEETNDLSEIIDLLNDPRRVEADEIANALRDGTTVASSKGLASNQRVRAMEYIFSEALKSKNHD